MPSTIVVGDPVLDERRPEGRAERDEQRDAEVGVATQRGEGDQGAERVGDHDLGVGLDAVDHPADRGGLDPRIGGELAGEVGRCGRASPCPSPPRSPGAPRSRRGSARRGRRRRPDERPPPSRCRRPRGRAGTGRRRRRRSTSASSISTSWCQRPSRSAGSQRVLISFGPHSSWNAPWTRRIFAMAATLATAKATVRHRGVRDDAPMTAPGERPLFLHEYIDIVGQHQWDYMEHAKRQAGHEKVDFELLGTWYTMGITGRWPQVVNIWDIPGGWDGWYGKVDRLGMKRMSQRPPRGLVGGRVRLPHRRLRPAARGRAGLSDDGIARRRRRAGLALRARAHRGAARHRARLPRRGAARSGCR